MKIDHKNEVETHKARFMSKDSKKKYMNFPTLRKFVVFCKLNYIILTTRYLYL